MPKKSFKVCLSYVPEPHRIKKGPTWLPTWYGKHYNSRNAIWWKMSVSVLVTTKIIFNRRWK